MNKGYQRGGMKMKKLFKSLLLSALVLCLFGCSNEQTNEPVEQEKEPEVVDTITIDMGVLLEEIVAEHFAEGSFIDYDEEFLINKMDMDMNLVVSYIGKYPMRTGMVPVEIGMFEVSEGNVDKVVELVDAYREAKTTDREFYPIVQDAAENALVYTRGNYVFFIMSEEPSLIQAQIDAEFDAQQ